MPRTPLLIALVMLAVISLAACTTNTASLEGTPVTEPGVTEVPTSGPTATTTPAPATTTPAPATMIIEEADYRGVIFSAAETEQHKNGILGLGVPADTEEFWSPAAADVAQMEAQILPALLADERLRDGVGWRPVRPLAEALPDYTRQYLGYLTADDEAVIYASFYCNASVEELTAGWGIVLDGGDCYFQIKYNTDTDQYFGLRVNGVA